MNRTTTYVALAFIGMFTSFTITAQNNVGIGTTSPKPSAILDLESTTQGLLPPRLTRVEILTIPSPAAGLLVYNTTANTLSFFNGTVWLNIDGGLGLVATVQQRLDGVVVTAETPKQIYDSGMPLDSLYGKIYKEGLIAYLETSTGAGFVAAPADILGTKEWGCVGTLIVGADGTAIGTGYQNTLDIIANSCQQNDGIQSAAEVCAATPVNGGTPWYLPSKDELYQMYKNLHRYGCSAAAPGGFDNTSCASGLGGLTNDFYWSSTEHDALLAIGQDYNTGSQFATNKDYSGAHVRAIRAF